MPDPDRFVWINDLVCEGCGDCSVASNCLSVEPLETPLGRKRRINLSSCNKDFSCLEGFCPSFVTVRGGTRRTRGIDLDPSNLTAGLPAPVLPTLDQPFDLLVTGVGGTGVVTVGALITMAAHLEGKGASVLDFTGFAQKFGTVLSYIRLGSAPDVLNQVRIDQRAADAVIGCDIVVSSAPKASAHYRNGTRIVLNRAEMPTGDLVLRWDAQLDVSAREQAIQAVVGADNLWAFDANAIAEQMLGDTVFANVIMLGHAWQGGLVPVSDLALMQAIDLNAVAVEKNHLAFAIGRVMAHAPDRLPNRQSSGPSKETLEQMIDRRTDFLTAYQNAAYARSYVDRLAQLQRDLPEAPPALFRSVARNLFRFMAYKDEYEVARLMTHDDFTRDLAQRFEGDLRLSYHMAPPMLSWRKDEKGRPQKIAIGRWVHPIFRVLTRMRGLRGTIWNPFGYHTEAKLHQQILSWYLALLDRMTDSYGDRTPEQWLDALNSADEIRGYGHVRTKAAKAAFAETQAQ